MNQRDEEYQDPRAYFQHHQNHHQKVASGAIVKDSFPIIKSSLTGGELI